MREARGSGCTVVWSPDGQFVEKRYDRMWWWFLDHRHDKFERERRIGMLLRRQPPPVRVAHLVGVDRRHRTLRFQAVNGGPLGPKFPADLPVRDLDAMIELALAMASYRPRAGFASRFDLARRVHRAVRDGCLPPEAAAKLLDQAENDPPAIVFAHGDITARNVLRSDSGGRVLIDWEWAGRYPRGWDLAFLWFSVVDTPNARQRVEQAIPQRDQGWFWRSALLIQLLHLSLPGLAPGSEFRSKHEASLDELLSTVL